MRFDEPDPSGPQAEEIDDEREGFAKRAIDIGRGARVERPVAYCDVGD